MKSKSDVKSTRSVPPLAPCFPPPDDLLDAGDANPALTSRPAPIAKATTESQTLLLIGLLSMNRGEPVPYRPHREHILGPLDAGPPGLLVLRARVEAVPEPVAQQIERQGREQDGEARPEHQPGHGCVELGRRSKQH